MRLSTFSTAVACLGAVASANPVPEPHWGNPGYGPYSFIGSPSCTSTPTVTPSAPPVCQPTGSDHGGNTSISDQPNFTFDQLWNMQMGFLDAFMYPANVVQAKSINSSLFSPDILGRVDLTRTFDGPELNTEYLFGLFTNIALNPEVVTLLGIPMSYEVVHFAASQNVVSASTIIYFLFPAINQTVPIEIDTWNMFDKDGLILQYDATFRWFQYLFDTLIGIAMPIFGATTPTQMVGIFQQLIAGGICNTHQSYCNGTNVQYDSYDSCFSFLTEQIRFGAAYELGMNTLVCRMVHENMVAFRPSVHCPHIGPSGGGMCVDDYTYFTKVLEPFFTNAPFVPYGYQNTNETIAAQ